MKPQHRNAASLRIKPDTLCRQEIIKCTLHAYIDVINACSSLQTFDEDQAKQQPINLDQNE